MKGKPITLSKNRLDAWLSHLSASDEGKLALINLFLSVKHFPLNKAKTLSFLLDCTSRDSVSADQALERFKAVCNKNKKYFALYPVKASTIAADTTLSTAMAAFPFHEYIVGRSKTLFKTVMPLEPRVPGDAIEESKYRSALARATSKPDWHKDNSYLGKPFPDPRHVWFTEQAILESEIKSDASKNGEATNIRDALGLIDMKGNTYALSVQFSAGQLHGLRGVKMARPVFADNGNRRFVSHLTVRKAKSIYSRDWGITVHLGRLTNKPTGVTAGVPERICSPIPLDKIGGSIKVEPLGWVVGDRGNQIGLDDNSTFVNRVLGRKKLENMKLHLLKYATAP